MREKSIEISHSTQYLIITGINAGPGLFMFITCDHETKKCFLEVFQEQSTKLGDVFMTFEPTFLCEAGIDCEVRLVLDPTKRFAGLVIWDTKARDEVKSSHIFVFDLTKLQ